MIDLDLPLHAAFDWHVDREAARLVRGNGYVRMFQHEMLIGTICLENHALHCLVKERVRNPAQIETSATSAEELFEQVAKWPLDSVLLSVYRGANGLSVEFLSGTVRTSPLYIAWTPERVRASWDVSSLCTEEAMESLDVPVLCAEIALENSYTHRTFLRNTVRLLERMHVRADKNGIHVREPAPAPMFTPRQLSPNADPVGAYAQLLQAALARPAWPAERTAFELSGGMDSASLVAISSTSSTPARFTSGTLLPGEVGEQQRKRRKQIRQLLNNSEDIAIDGADAICFSPLDRAFSTIPFQNPNSPVGSALLKQLCRRGITTIVTGIGGDELFSLHPWEQDAYPAATPKSLPYLLHVPGNDGCFISADGTAPLPHVAASALLAACNRAAMFMREGVWLVNPLCSPELTRFAQQLPVEWRTGRRLLRELLAKLGLASFAKPYPSETYDELNMLNIREHQANIRLLFQRSRLADLGILDRAALVTCFERWLAGDKNLSYDYFHAAITLELFFQRNPEPF